MRLSSDDHVREVLLESLELIPSDDHGNPVDQAEATRCYAALGPVSLPVTLSSGRTTVFEWTTFARVHDDLWDEWKAAGSPERLSPTFRLRLLQQLSHVREWPQAVVTYGDFQNAEAPVVRIHSNCATGDLFNSQRCECGPQLRAALAEIERAGAGAVVYLADHEGRGIGLFAKAAAYLLQDRGLDTYEANRCLGFEDDERDFSDAAFIIKHLREPDTTVRLLSNNPEKADALKAHGIEVSDMVPLVRGITASNMRYLSAKRAFGHIIPEALLKPSDEWIGSGISRGFALLP